MNIRPTSFLLKTVLLLLGLSIAQLFYTDLEMPVYFSLGLFVVVFLTDFLLSCRKVKCSVIREMSSTLPLGVASKVKLEIINEGSFTLVLTMTDQYLVPFKPFL